MSAPRLPAEWEPQSGTQLTWPHRDTDWADNLDAAWAVFVEIGCAIAADQPLLSVCRDSAHKKAVHQALLAGGAETAHLHFALAASDDTWARDHGPITTLVDGRAILNDFEFDGWGGKYPADQDNLITHRLYTRHCFANATLVAHALVLEGGAVETDGQGTLLATRSSVLDATRNPNLPIEKVEALLRAQLGIQRFLWLDHGSLSGDDTDAHIDVLARFSDPHNLLISTAPDDHPDHAALTAMANQLGEFRAYDGRPLSLHPLPSPGLHKDQHGQWLPASYANFLITNHSVLVPTYGVDADTEALQLIGNRFPGRRVIGIDCRTIIAQHGSLHCLTMQFPQALKLSQTNE